MFCFSIIVGLLILASGIACSMQASGNEYLSPEQRRQKAQDQQIDNGGGCFF